MLGSRCINGVLHDANGAVRLAKGVPIPCVSHNPKRGSGGMVMAALPNTTTSQHALALRIGQVLGCIDSPECIRKLGLPAQGTTTTGGTSTGTTGGTTTGSTGSTGSGSGASGGTGGTPTTTTTDYNALLKKYWPLLLLVAIYFWAGAE